jgi:hypothetical protein
VDLLKLSAESGPSFQRLAMLSGYVAQTEMTIMAPTDPVSGGQMSKFDLLLHIVATTLWAGTAILIAGFLMPAIRAAGPGGSAVMRQLTVVRKLPEILATVGIVAILS